MESKRKNVYITIFVITTIIAAGLAIFFKVDSDNKLKSMEAKVEENLGDNSAQESRIDVSLDNKTEAKNVETKYVFYPEIDSSKCINKQDGVEYKKESQKN